MRHELNFASAVFATVCLSALSTAASAQVAAPTPQWTNTGEYKVPVFEGHDLSSPAELARAASSILYCPSESDDANYRAAISAASGGATVDYFDTRAGNPGLALLQTYDAVYTWANYAYFDNVGFGDELALYNDGGGNVILGSFCTYTTGNYLAGNIMTPAYCPVVSPTGTNHFSLDRYAGDGTTCLDDGVTQTTGVIYRDYLQLQGNGVLDGTYQGDGEIFNAYQKGASGATIVYNNGCGAIQLIGAGGGGDWPIFVSNAADCLATGLTGAPSSISMATGGAQALTLEAGVALAGNPWFIAGTTSGTFPGIPFLGDTIPLNFDFYTNMTLTGGGGVLLPTSGVVGPTGQAFSNFVLPPIPALVGVQVHHAAVVLDIGTGSLLMVSDPVSCDLTS
jgi:hypothetical protein